MNDLAKFNPPSMPAWMTPTSLDQALALADRVASSGLVPDHLKGNPGGVLMIMDQAQRWGMSPLAVAQCTSIVRGKLCYEGKLVHAALVSMGAIIGCLRYEYSGPEKSEQRRVTVRGTLRDGTECEAYGSVSEWKTTGNGSPWNPGNYDKMLAYRGAREWARLYAPAAMLGVYTPDEAIEVEAISVHDDPPPAKIRTVDTPAPFDGPSASDVAAVVKHAAAAMGGDAGIYINPILDRFGVSKSADIAEAQRAEFIDEIKAAVDQWADDNANK